MGPSFLASASAISSAYLGTTTALALMHERPPLSAMLAAITSMKLGQFSIWSSPMTNLLQPGPWIWIAGLCAYCWVVDLSPKIKARPHKFRMAAAPS